MDDNRKYPPVADANFAKKVGAQASRKIKTLENGNRSVWFGLGMSGLVGWSVAVPTVVGGLAGFWWDRHHPSSHSWTLALLAAGLFIGCWNAWHWVVREDQAMHDDSED